MRIQEYETATGSSLDELDRNVNALIRKGFEPSGRVRYIDCDTVGPRGDQKRLKTFFQTMVRCGPSPEEMQQQAQNMKGISG